MFPLAFVAQSLQGHWWGFISRNYVVWPIFFLMNVFIALKGTHFWILFTFTESIQCTKQRIWVWFSLFVNLSMDMTKGSLSSKVIIMSSEFQKRLKFQTFTCFYNEFKPSIWYCQSHKRFLLISMINMIYVAIATFELRHHQLPFKQGTSFGKPIRIQNV